MLTQRVLLTFHAAYVAPPHVSIYSATKLQFRGKFSGERLELPQSPSRISHSNRFIMVHTDRLTGKARRLCRFVENDRRHRLIQQAVFLDLYETVHKTAIFLQLPLNKAGFLHIPCK